MKENKASNMAKGGMLIAFTLIILYAANFITFNTLFLLGLASALISLFHNPRQNSLSFLCANLWSLWHSKVFYRAKKKYNYRNHIKTSLF